MQGLEGHFEIARVMERPDRLSPARLFITALLLAAALSADAGLPFMSETVSWEEEVLLADGRLFSIRRTVTYGPDAWGRSGRGALKEQTIRFVHEGREVEWKNSDRWPIIYMPDVLDFVGGVPVVVMPVHRWGPCNKYGFPAEGLVAFGYRKGRWDRIATAELPSELKVNLLRSTHAIQYWKEYRHKRITPADKQSLERNGWGSTKQGLSLSDASKFYADYEDSCVRMRPPPNKQLDEARQRNADAERNATTIAASVLSVATEPELVTREMFRDQKGQWTGVGYLTGSCKGIVEKIEPLQQWSGDENGYRSALVGYQLLLQDAPADRRKVQIEEASRAQMQCVVCDPSTIFVVRRQDKQTLIVHRFDHGGDLVDAFRIALPDTTKVVPDPDWGTLWTVTPDGQANISLSVVDYSYPQTANLGGTIKRKVSYSARLPVR